MSRGGAAAAGRAVASFAGIGFVPLAPGTVGSLAALVLGVWALQGAAWGVPVLAMLAVLATVAGLVAIPFAVTDREADPGWVVIDEVAGQWIALLGLGALTPVGALAAFGLFRLFDIWKPGPVGWADRQKGAMGIMLDDVIAGAMAAAVLLVARWVGVL